MPPSANFGVWPGKDPKRQKDAVFRRTRREFEARSGFVLVGTLPGEVVLKFGDLNPAIFLRPLLAIFGQA